VIYTTPLKALSNQKLAETAARFGSSRCGLQTGDTSLNTEADIVVMTTEILRNIMYRWVVVLGWYVTRMYSTSADAWHSSSRLTQQQQQQQQQQQAHTASSVPLKQWDVTRTYSTSAGASHDSG
jgi:hypothetical protein